VGQSLNGKWTVDKLLDVGGMGAVYEATHRNGRRAAIKVLHTRFARDPEVRKRFLPRRLRRQQDRPPGRGGDPRRRHRRGRLTLPGHGAPRGRVPRGLACSAVGGRLPVNEVLAVAGQVLEVLVAAHAARHRPPRPQARQRLRDPGGPRQAARLRPGPHPRRRALADSRRRRASSWGRRIHGTRTGARYAGSGRPPERHLRDRLP